MSEAVLAVAGRAGRPESGDGAVSADATVAGSATGAGLGADAPGAGAAQGRDASASVAGVPRGPPGRVSVQPFRDRYREWCGRLDVVLRQVYRAGEKAFVDYAGSTVEVTDRRTGEIREAMGVRRGAGSVELHLRGPDTEPVAAGLDGVARADVRVLGRRAGARDPEQRKGGGAADEPVRTARNAWMTSSECAGGS